VDLSMNGFLRTGFINPVGLWQTLSKTIRIARGKLRGPWENSLFPASAVQQKRRLVRWARLLLAGHAAIILTSILLRWWLLPVVTTLAPFYGGWLHYLCNNSQHAGLQDNVPDFRLCCRTITLNPFLSFLYWHMNYHTEHHMYAAVPCYRLRNLHDLIRHDLPPCAHGLYATWIQIAAILRQQRRNPAYQYVQELPAHAIAGNR
jgi:fatty acid desaturase